MDDAPRAASQQRTKITVVRPGDAGYAEAVSKAKGGRQGALIPKRPAPPVPVGSSPRRTHLDPSVVPRSAAQKLDAVSGVSASRKKEIFLAAAHFLMNFAMGTDYKTTGKIPGPTSGEAAKSSYFTRHLADFKDISHYAANKPYLQFQIRKALIHNSGYKLKDIGQIFNGLDRDRASALRILLVMAGVEQNPGPADRAQHEEAGPAQAAAEPSSERPAAAQAAAAGRPLSVVRPDGQQVQARSMVRPRDEEHVPRGDARRAHIAEQIREEVEQAQGEADARAEVALQDQVQRRERAEAEVLRLQGLNAELRAQQRRDEEDLADIRTRYQTLCGLGVEGYTEEGLIDEVEFCGVYDPPNVSYFTELVMSCLIVVRIYEACIFVLGGRIPITRIPICPRLLAVSGRALCTDDKVSRYRNIKAALRADRECAEFIDSHPFEMLQGFDFLCFVLAGVLGGGGRLRFANDFTEYVPQFYQVHPQPGWERLLRYVHFNNDKLRVHSTYCRKIRRAPVYVNGMCPHVPDYTDRWTQIAAIQKRLYPELPEPKPIISRVDGSMRSVESVTDELIDYILRHSRALTPSEETQAIEDCLKGRPQREVAEMRRGIELAREDPDTAIQLYCDQAYATFFKLEPLPEDVEKPMRLIMCLPLQFRGIQVYFMAPILKRIELGTREVNVKGMTSEAIEARLKEKFTGIRICLETDYSSFESQLSLPRRNLIENHLFSALANPVQERFIEAALRREHVAVRGPGFTIPRYHAIRFSGDLWTSIGNLVSNIVMTCCVLDYSVEDFIRMSVCEGDDCMTVCPDWCARSIASLENRAKDMGIKMTMLSGPWHSLSFCGMQFVEVDGGAIRYRDPIKTLCSLTTLFACDPTTTKNDAMLQRAKCISCLCGPWVPGASVFAAAYEYATRGKVVMKDDFLLKHGLLKEFSGYATEQALPQEFKSYSKLMAFCFHISARDRAAGGYCTPMMVKRVIDAIRENRGVDSADLFGQTAVTRSQWIERVGLRVFENTQRLYQVSPPLLELLMREDYRYNGWQVGYALKAVWKRLLPVGLFMVFVPYFIHLAKVGESDFDTWYFEAGMGGSDDVPVLVLSLDKYILPSFRIMYQGVSGPLFWVMYVLARLASVWYVSDFPRWNFMGGHLYFLKLLAFHLVAGKKAAHLRRLRLALIVLLACVPLPLSVCVGFYYCCMFMVSYTWVFVHLAFKLHKPYAYLKPRLLMSVVALSAYVYFYFYPEKLFYLWIGAVEMGVDDVHARWTACVKLAERVGAALRVLFDFRLWFKPHVWDRMIRICLGIAEHVDLRALVQDLIVR